MKLLRLIIPSAAGLLLATGTLAALRAAARRRPARRSRPWKPTCSSAASPEHFPRCGAQPWAMAATPFNVWVSDTGRSKLIRLDRALKLDLPLLSR